MVTPLPAIRGLNAAQEIDSFRAGKQDFLEQQKRDLLKEAGGLAAAGNMAGARNKLYSGGEFGEARAQSGEMRAQSAEARAIQQHAQSLDDAKLAKVAKSQELLGNVADSIMKSANPQAALDQAKAILGQRGLKVENITLDQLPMLKQQNVTVQQAFANEMQERAMRNQEAEAIRAQTNIDRSFSNTLERQRAQDQLAERDYLTGREDKRLDRQYQDRTLDATTDFRRLQQRVLEQRAMAAAAKANAPKPLTESQATARAYLGELEDVNKQLLPETKGGKNDYSKSILTEKGESPLDAGTSAVALSNYSPAWVSKAVTNKKEKQFLQAAEQFISVLLYKRSGAQISADEFSRNFRIYFPQPGDDQGTLRQKTQARARVLDGLKIQGGYDAPGVPDAPAPNSAADMSDEDLGALFQ